MTDPLHGKRVLIIGFGRQGRSLARWLPTVGAKVIVNDGRDEKTLNLPQDEYAHVRFVLGDHPVSLVEEADIVCVSGGVPLELPLIQAAYKAGLTITNDAQLFMERCPAPVIGITGSAGKTTTTRLVGDIMQQSGFRTWVGGNIGDVLLDVLPQIAPQDRVVMELSSFQLELMTNSPQIAAVLNITPNHLDRHGTMENYTAAKANIIAHQRPDDMAILGYDDAGSHALEEAVCSQLLWFSMR
ncbi:MAG: UDP-N-acetylmuramoyl-L-alanine--D-glutamate ligase, partial [Chloroflexi bacterium]